MIRSMTGFGKAESVLPEKKITVELRSLNSKQADINVRIPQFYREKEVELRQLITARLERGKIDLNINYDLLGEDPAGEINRPLVISYFNQLQKVAGELGIQGGEQLLAAVLRMPETVKTTRQELGEEEWKIVVGTLEKAIEELDRFRMQEGRTLEKDLRMRIGIILEKLAAVSAFEDDRIQKIRERIGGSLENFLGKDGIDSNRLEQELIYYLEKLDITEEKVRLKTHCEYFMETLQMEEAPGKKLGFISQEIGREINTLGSKANQTDIQKLVVEMKDELEKIKEQILNLL